MLAGRTHANHIGGTVIIWGTLVSPLANSDPRYKEIGRPKNIPRVAAVSLACTAALATMSYPDYEPTRLAMR